MFTRSTRILVADDMEIMRAMVTSSLFGLGYFDVTEAADGMAAWNALETANPPIDLIISDLNMPNLTGMDFLKKVRKDPRFTSIPFILLTSEAEVTQVREAVAAGVSNYCVKPFTAEVFKQKLEQTYMRLMGIK